MHEPLQLPSHGPDTTQCRMEFEGEDEQSHRDRDDPEADDPKQHQQPGISHGDTAFCEGGGGPGRDGG